MTEYTSILESLVRRHRERRKTPEDEFRENFGASGVRVTLLADGGAELAVVDPEGYETSSIRLTPYARHKLRKVLR